MHSVEIMAVILWMLLGLTVFVQYCRSDVEITTKGEIVLAAFCGPAVWVLFLVIAAKVWLRGRKKSG